MPQLIIDQAFQTALGHHQSGRLPLAESLYRQILAQQPKHAGALHYLGVLAHQAGRNDIALELIRQAIALRPRDPQAHNNLSIVLREMAQFDQSIAACHQALALKSDFAEAYTNLGNVFRDQGHPDNAIAAYRQAITIAPNHFDAIANLGTALRDKGQLDESITAYRQAIALNPKNPDAHTNLGNALRDKGQVTEAIAVHRHAIALNPKCADAYGNLGVALRDAGQLDQAIAAYRQAIALKPNYAEAHGNLANALGDSGQPDQAIAAYRQAIALKPDHTLAHSNLVYAIHYHSDYDAKAIADEHHLWNRQHAQPLKPFIQPHTNDRDPDRRLRIGYVSSDFRAHAVGRFLHPLLSHHDNTRVQVFAYSASTAVDLMTERLRSHIDVWRNIVGISDAAVAEQIRQDKIDILVDLSMHSAGNRLLIFARKPAPVQVTYLAYAGGTALDTIDYRLTDRYLDPDPANDKHYMEKSFRLKGTYWCYEHNGAPLPVNELPASTTTVVTFGCLNNSAKITQHALSAWAELLNELPDARMLLHSPVGEHRKTLQGYLEQRGISPDRLEIVGHVSPNEYFRTYHRIDIALDPFPYGGGTTTCDALWMGVPVVTLAGRTAVGRAGVSILSNVGLPELVAQSTEEYIQIATDLARDIPRLSTLRSTLRAQMAQSTLMDAPRFAANIESAYRQMWRTWCETSISHS